jgi:hypothetical protein
VIFSFSAVLSFYLSFSFFLSICTSFILVWIPYFLLFIVLFFLGLTTPKCFLIYLSGFNILFLFLRMDNDFHFHWMRSKICKPWRWPDVKCQTNQNRLLKRKKKKKILQNFTKSEKAIKISDAHPNQGR